MNISYNEIIHPRLKRIPVSLSSGPEDFRVAVHHNNGVAVFDNNRSEEHKN